MICYQLEVQDWRRPSRANRLLNDNYDGGCYYIIFLQYHADANEAESWIKEREPLVSSEDYGTNESSATGLLQNHDRLQGEIKDYSSEIDRLKELSKKVASSASTTATFVSLYCFIGNSSSVF